MREAFYVLEITETAAQKIGEIVADAGAPVIGLRIAVSTGGCAGIQYRMGLDTRAEEDDEIVPCAGTKVLIDADSSHWLNGAVVDFRTEDFGDGSEAEAGFVFDNPNAQGLCSCGGGEGACGTEAELC